VEVNGSSKHPILLQYGSKELYHTGFNVMKRFCNLRMLVIS